MNTFGTIFRLTTFGESHGQAIGGIIDNFPSNIVIDIDFIQNELNRRRPGQSSITSSRNESDHVEILSGIYNGKSTGTPIGFIIRNNDHHSSEYEKIKHAFRPSHADYTYQMKYGIRDYRGGGRASARETAVRCVAGAFAKLVLKKLNINIVAYTSQVGNIALDKDYNRYDLNNIESNIIRCPDANTANQMIDLISALRAKGDTIGGIITCIIQGVPVGLGEPIFGKLHAALGNAMLSINAVKGFEYGDGFDVSSKGSEVNDVFINDNGQVKTITNHSGGIQGGISNGEDIYFRVAFKPVATILKEQNSIDYNGKLSTIKAQGRHDPCVLARAVPIVEAMAAITILDYYMQNKSLNIN